MESKKLHTLVSGVLLKGPRLTKMCTFKVTHLVYMEHAIERAIQGARKDGGFWPYE